MSRDEKNLLIRTYFIFLCSGAVSTLTGAILPDMQAEYNLSYTLRGLLLSFQQCGNLSAMLLAGILPFMIGRKKCTLILSSSIVSGILMFVFFSNPIVLILAFALTGVGRGALSNTSNVVVSTITNNSPAGLNILHASFALGALASPIIAALLGSNWKVSSIIFALLMALSIFLINNSILSNDKEKRVEGEKNKFYLDIDFYLVTFTLFFYLCSEASLMGWMVTYFNETGLLSASSAKIMQSLIWIMILLGRLISASISPKIKNKMVLVTFLGFGFTIFFILMMCVKSQLLMIASLLFVGLSMSGIYPTTISTQNPKYNSDTIATGTCMALATVGGVLWPNIIGLIAEASGLKNAMLSIIIPLIAMDTLIIIKLFRHMASKSYT